MTKAAKFRPANLLLGWWLLCSCSTFHRAHFDRPAEAAINPAAGRGEMVNVTLRLKDGTPITCLVDTGAGATVLNQSFVSKLGKSRGASSIRGWGGSRKAVLYAAPALYLGKTRLKTSENVWVDGQNSPPGILGMDCLRHYCVQFDFATGTMRFLDRNQIKPAELGQAYPIFFKGNLPFIHHAGLIGKSGRDLLLDLGCRADGLEEKSAIHGLAQILPECSWDGATYTNLAVAAVEHANVLGLGFFARHLVTFDFPGKMMYLKQTSAGPLSSAQVVVGPVECWETLHAQGQLPGLLPKDAGNLYVESYVDDDPSPSDKKGLDYSRAFFRTAHQSVTFNFWKTGDASIYCHEVARPDAASPWILDKAWRTDQNGQLLENYPLK